MDINFILGFIQLIAGIAIIVLVLLQQQESGFYSRSTNINRTRRGTEKLIFNFTIATAITFVVVSIANFLV